jgi:hypothetical protein
MKEMSFMTRPSHLLGAVAACALAVGAGCGRTAAIDPDARGARAAEPAGPAIEDLARRATEGALDEALSATRRDELARLGESVGRAAAAGWTGALGPELRRAVDEHVGPAMAEQVRSPEIRRAAAALAREIGEDAFLTRTDPPADVRPGEQVGVTFGRAVGLVAAILAVALVALLTVLLGREHGRRRRIERDAREREHLLATVLTTVLARHLEPEDRDRILRQLGVGPVSESRDVPARSDEPPSERTGPWPPHPHPSL